MVEAAFGGIARCIHGLDAQFCSFTLVIGERKERYIDSLVVKVAGISREKLFSDIHAALLAGLGEAVNDQSGAPLPDIVLACQYRQAGCPGIKYERLLQVCHVALPPVAPGMVPCRHAQQRLTV